MKSIESRLSKALLVLAVVYGSSVNASHKERLILHNDKTNSLEVLDKGKIYPVQKAFLDRDIRDIDPRVVLQAQKKGLLTLYPTVLTGGEAHDFGIRSHVNGKGGGPVLGTIFYWGTKVILYGTMAAGVATAISSVGPTAGAGGAAKALTAKGAAGNVLAASGHVNIAGPAGLVAVGIKGAGGGKAAATGTAIAAVSGVSISGMVEAAALAAYAAGLAVPCP